MENYYLVITTMKKEEEIKRISNILLNKRLCACINYFPISSIFWWKKNLHEEEEYMLIIKTREELLEKVKKEILSIHPYDTAEFIAIKIDDISLHFSSWIDRETNKIY